MNHFTDDNTNGHYTESQLDELNDRTEAQIDTDDEPGTWEYECYMQSLREKVQSDFDTEFSELFAN